MKLRDHPLISFGGRCHWPPMWMPIPRHDDTTTDEVVGILEEVYGSVIDDRRCYLIVNQEGQTYMGTLQLENSEFCKELCELLKRNCGRQGNCRIGYSSSE